VVRKILRHRLVKNDTANRDAVLALLVAFFGSAKKAEIWMQSKNPLLGGITPEFMVECGRSERLLRFVRDRIEENKR
jgi:hypothetical protein